MCVALVGGVEQSSYRGGEQACKQAAERLDCIIRLLFGRYTDCAVVVASRRVFLLRCCRLSPRRAAVVHCACVAVCVRDVREWLSTFPFPPIPIPNFLTYSHSHGIPVSAIPIPSHFTVLSMLKLYIISDTVIIIICS